MLTLGNLPPKSCVTYAVCSWVTATLVALRKPVATRCSEASLIWIVLLHGPPVPG